MMLIVRLASSLLLSGSFLISFAVAAQSIQSRTVTNQMRYAKNEDSRANFMPLMQLLELASTSSRQAISTLPYSSDRLDRPAESSKYHEGRFLDDEDRRLLDEFYRETKSSDPFLGDDLSIEGLWDEDREKTSGRKANGPLRAEPIAAVSSVDDGWTFDQSIIDGLNGKPYEYNLGPSIDQETTLRANYSPTLDLLTSYNPVVQIGGVTEEHTQSNKNNQADLSLKSSNRIVGATLFGQDQSSKPNISSKSATDAIRLHNDMLRRPPNDGKVRVRMYFHRAIHDDAKLYGTGPWKYWGHGWGLEFGYDPRKSNGDFYQRGYTIERAFGRDFCKDNKNCRKPDSNFFRDPNDVGKYSEQFHRDTKRLKETEGRHYNGVSARVRTIS